MQHEGTCFIIGRFDPPNRLNFNTTRYLSTREHITQVIILLGNEGEYLDIDQRYQIWNYYLRTDYNTNIKVEKGPSPNKSCMYNVHRLFIENPEMKAFIAVDEVTSQDENFAKFFNGFKNFYPEIIPSQFEGLSKTMIKALEEDDKAGFLAGVPNDLPEESKEGVWQVAKGNSDFMQKEFVSGPWWHDLVKNRFK